MFYVKYDFLSLYGRVRMRVEFTSTYANVVSSNLSHDEVFSIQHYVKMFISDLRQVGGFVRVHRFPQPIKLQYCC